MANKSLHRSRWPNRSSKTALLLTLLLSAPAWGREEAGLDGAPVATTADLLTPVAHVRSASPAPQARNATLMLDVAVNGVGRGLLPFTMIDNQLWTTRQVLQDLGLRIATAPAAAAADDMLLLDDALGGAAAGILGQMTCKGGQ